MPSKNRNPLLPYLDPDFVPDHPKNNIPDLSVVTGEYWGEPRDLTPKELARAEKEWMDKQMEDWKPPHVERSWETRADLEKRREHILKMTLPPRIKHDYEDLARPSLFDSSISKQIADDLYNPMRDPDQTDFRRFANLNLHLGYHRFHASLREPNLPPEEEDLNLPAEDVCWLMEYTEGECHIIRRKIAKMMGEFPAVTDEKNDFYDEEIAWRYERRLYVRCRRKTKKCVRPSHIVLFGSNFQDIP